VRWWLNTDPPNLFSVDNASVSGMDFSGLDSDIFMIQWTDGKGEIERQFDKDTNDNGLREGFFDVTPYAPLFQQFLRKTPWLTLDQAKKVQIDLILQLFDSKRQMPFHYAVAAGDYWWDASDGSMYAGSIPSIQNLNASVGQIIARINSIQSWLDSLCGVISSGISDVGDNVVYQINNNVVGIHNAAIYADNVNNVAAGDALVNYINTVICPAIKTTLLASVPSGEATILVNGAAGTGAQSSTVIDFVDNPYNMTSISADFVSISPPSYAALPPVGSTNVQWIPIGSSTPVNVTPAEQAAILQGIASRTNALNQVKYTKTAEVTALTTIDSVIDYDVTTGWPATPLPPGFDPNKLFTGASANVAFVGASSGGGGGGVPEAPSDNVTYGRRNAVWNPALALSGDILDGGNF